MTFEGSSVDVVQHLWLSLEHQRVLRSVPFKGVIIPTLGFPSCVFFRYDLKVTLDWKLSESSSLVSVPWSVSLNAFDSDQG